jgi:hypothetical protein
LRRLENLGKDGARGTLWESWYSSKVILMYGFEPPWEVIGHIKIALMEYWQDKLGHE